MTKNERNRFTNEKTSSAFGYTNAEWAAYNRLWEKAKKSPSAMRAWEQGKARLGGGYPTRAMLHAEMRSKKSG